MGKNDPQTQITVECICADSETATNPNYVQATKACTAKVTYNNTNYEDPQYECLLENPEKCPTPKKCIKPNPLPTTQGLTFDACDCTTPPN